MTRETDEAAERLRAVIRTLNRRAQRDTGEDSPTRSQQAVLAWLQDKGSLSPSELAALERVRPQSMGQTVDGLVRRGWVERGAHATDRRQVVLSLTADGRAAVQRGRALRQARFTDAMDKLSAGERRTLIEAIGLLERIVSD